jgi:hypothetical protein
MEQLCQPNQYLNTDKMSLVFKILPSFLLLLSAFASCKKNNPDEPVLPPQEPGWRLQAYNYMPAGNKYQSVIPKVLHHHFNDRGAPVSGEEAIEASTQRFVKQNALLFFNYYLNSTGDIHLLGTLGNVPGVVNSKK